MLTDAEKLELVARLTSEGVVSEQDEYALDLASRMVASGLYTFEEVKFAVEASKGVN